jgi:ParB family chromosome partitioning protein
MAKQPGLGRGLSALIDTEPIKTSGSSSINEVELTLIYANPNQPRRHFDEESLTELSNSIKEMGVISPITLRKNEDGTYLIIAGERRYRASKKAGLKAIPAYIKTVDDEELMEMALIENIQREDLNAIEIALTFQRLMEEYTLTQERLSERVGKKRATIANYVRLLRLPADIQIGIKDRKIDMGHARAILGLDDAAAQLKLFVLILEEKYAVRKVEELVRNYQETGTFEESQKDEKTIQKTSKTASGGKEIGNLADLKETEDLKNRLSDLLGTKVSLSINQKGKGKISIPFSSDEDLARIMGLLDKI